MEAVRLLHTGYQAAIDEMRSVRSDPRGQAGRGVQRGPGLHPQKV